MSKSTTSVTYLSAVRFC